MSESKAEDYVRSPAKEWLKRQIVRSFDSALVGGTPQLTYALSLGLSPDQIFIGYDAVDNDFWANRAADVRSKAAYWRAELGLPQHFFLTACRLVPKKNVDGLLRSYAMYVQDTTQPWPFIVAGDGRMRSDLEQLARTLGVTDHVRFVGYLKAEAMAPYYALASLFILASKTSEQWGLVVNEAMAAGTPVGVSQVCGSAPDLVVTGQTGFSFDPQDETELARLLVTSSQNPNELERIGRAAQTRVAQFSPEVFARNFLAAANTAQTRARKRGTGYTDYLILSASRRLLREPNSAIE
ncbi:MAG: glycosyltransferase [Anaerolinea sp.]|nr:glycosyltransferase [Anaerolinea sp.]